MNTLELKKNEIKNSLNGLIANIRSVKLKIDK